MRPTTRVTLAGTLLLLVGCGHSRGARIPNASDADGDDPLRALAAPVTSTRYAHAFWMNEARRRTPIWDSAYAFCSRYWRAEDGSKPNCGAVYTANFFQSAAGQPVPNGTRR